MPEQTMTTEKAAADVLLPVFEVQVTPDQLVAYLRVSNVPEEVELLPDQLLAALAGKGITLGIFRTEIEEFCSSKRYFKELKVAKGRSPVNGRDGSIIYHFNTEQKGSPRELLDGSVNFKDLSLIHNVKNGDLLCEIIPPTKGIAGKDVFGRPVPAKEGKLPMVSIGKNVETSENGLKFTAAVEGRVELANGTLSVEEVYQTSGDVGPETGNIAFNGTVIIAGNVADGFRVEAKKDILISGLAEGADIKAGENVVINNGMNGMNKGVIFAGGNVTARFLENTTVICGGDFLCDCALNCKVKAGGSIRMTGKRASLLGGTYVAGDEIVADIIGSQLNIGMDVIISPEWYEIEINGRKWEELDYMHDDIAELKDKIRDKQREAEKFGSKIQEVVSGKRLLSPTEKAAYIKRMMGLREEKMRNVLRLEKKVQRAEEYQLSHEFSITVKGEVFPGVRVSIRGEMLKINRLDKNKRYYIYAGCIEATTPSGEA